MEARRVVDATQSRTDLIVAGMVGLAAFAIYSWGACPTIYVGDSGELVAAAYRLGIPHPSGYPLYVLLGKLWTLVLPVGSVAWRMSIFSAVCCSAACASVYSTGRALHLSRAPALAGALLLAFGPSFWSQATIQRVYGLNALFVVLGLRLVLAWSHERERRQVWLAAFVCGLGTSNHLFMVVFAACAAVYIVLTEPRVLMRAATLVGAVVAFGVGLTPYLYLPLRSRQDPRLDWGDPETLDRLRSVVFREDFWNRSWVEGPADVGRVALDYLLGFPAELTWVGAILVLVGLVWGLARGFWLLPLVMVANLASLTLHGSRSDLFYWHRYYIPTYVASALLVAAGADRLLRLVPPRSRGVVLLLPLFLAVSGWREHDRSRYRIAEDFSSTLLDALPPGAQLVAQGDNVLFPLIYLNFVEGRRPDVRLLLQGVGEARLPPLAFDPDREAVYFTHHPNWEAPGLELNAEGLAYRAWRAGRPRPEVAIPKRRLDGELDPRVPKDYLTENLIGHFHFMLAVTLEPTDWGEAVRELRIAEESAPRNDVLAYNVGLIYERNGWLEEAVVCFGRAHAINPRRLAGPRGNPTGPRLEEAERELRRLRSLRAGLADHPRLRDLVPGSPGHHLALAALLDELGEHRAALGHRRRAGVPRKKTARGVSPGGLLRVLAGGSV